jgi:hypothetical protein
MSTAGDYTVLKNIIAEYSYLGGQAWTTNTPIITSDTTNTLGPGSGSIVTMGGLSVNKNIYIGGTITGPSFPSIQYGISTIQGGNSITISLPTAYLNRNYSVHVTYMSTNTALMVIPSVSTLGTGSFMVTGNSGANFSWTTMGQGVLA